MRRLWASLIALVLAGTGGAYAQQAGGQGVFEVPQTATVPTILTVDLERLFAQSEFGQRISENYATAREDLALENRRIAESLRAEELALAAQRPDMDPDVFRTEATAFDEKAQGIRRAQDAKERVLEETLDRGRTQFLEATRPVLGQLMVDRGASAILDRRSVVLSLSSLEITDEAIELINEALGDSMPETQQD